MKFKNKTDTIVLLELISKFGLRKSIEKVEGMFAFGLWDKKQKKLFLVRDRFGEKPLFFYKNSNFIVFSSELRSLSKFPLINLKISRKSSYYYSMLGYIPAPLCIYENTFKVMPAEVISFGNKITKKNIYYQIPKPELNKEFSYEKCKKELLNTFEESIKKMMIADVEIGCFLSGGIDSSLVALLMQKNSKKKIKTFNVGFNESEYDESKFAKSVAEKIGSHHHDIKVNIDDMLGHIENIANIVNEPFSDSSIIPTFIISKLAASKVKVVLSGDGADEIFMGYNRYSFAKKIFKLKEKTPNILRQLIGQGIRLVPSRIYDSLSRPFQKLLGIHGFSHKMSKLSNILEFKNNSDFYEKLNIFDNEVLDNKSKYHKNIFDKYQNIDLVNSVQRNDIDFYLPNDILVKVDRASMFNSLEVRSPFLSHKVVNKAFELPIKFKLRNKTTKYILKDLLSDFLPNSFVNRPKMGFAIPIERWISNKKFRKTLDNIFHESCWEEFGWKREKVLKKWLDYKKFGSSTPQCIWLYLMAGLWLNKWR
jgi:asparagine synthase (glutamine-hydrolysing)